MLHNIRKSKIVNICKTSTLIIIKFCRENFWVHRWKYHNPYDRTCKVCKKHEVSYCANFDSWHRDWWETHRDGDESKHYT